MTSKPSQSKPRDDYNVDDKKQSKITNSPTSDHKTNTTRVCIKGLPPNYDETNLIKHLQHSSNFGEGNDGGLVITDCKVLKTKQGTSRKVAFVGFKTPEMAQHVITYFHKTYAQTSRLIVEAAVEKGNIIEKRKKRKGDQIIDKVSRDVIDDSSRSIDHKKEEFLSVMMGGSTHNKSMGGASRFWSNDGGMITENSVRLQPGKSETSDMRTAEDSMKGECDRSDCTNSGPKENREKLVGANTRKGGEGITVPVERSKDTMEARSTEISDMDFLRSKIVDTKDTGDMKDDDSTNSDSSSVTSSGSESGSDSSSMASSDSNSDNDEEDNKDQQISVDKHTDGTIKTNAERNGLVVVTTNRLFLRNLPFSATEDEIIEACSSCCGSEIVSCHIPIDESKRSKGYAFAKFGSVEDASYALEKLDGTTFQGRILHVLPAKEETDDRGGGRGEANEMANNNISSGMMTTHKKKIELSRQQEARSSTAGWSTNYIRGDAVVDNLASRLGLEKGDILNVKDDLSSGNAAVRLALGETHVIEENRKFFRKHGIDMDALLPSSAKTKNELSKRSQTTFLVKNLPYETSQEEITKVFHTVGGDAPNILLPPSRTIALAEYGHANDAKRAFRKLAYKRFKHVPLYLEWAPLTVESSNAGEENTIKTVTTKINEDGKATNREHDSILDDESEGRGHSCTLYVKNLNFKTNEKHLQSIFEEEIGRVQAVKIPTKVAAVRKIRGGEEAKVKHLSMGYGFVEMKSEEMARKALKLLQGKLVDGHNLELRLSTKDGNKLSNTVTKSKVNNRQNTKLMVRNVPFQTSRTELLKLFGSFGQLKNVRLPKKFDGGHRGFAFVEFVTGNEALNAMKALSQTHLYGRHLVLEWADDKDDIETLRGKAKRDAQTVGVMESNNQNKKIRFDD